MYLRGLDGARSNCAGIGAGQRMSFRGNGPELSRVIPSSRYLPCPPVPTLQRSNARWEWDRDRDSRATFAWVRTDVAVRLFWLMYVQLPPAAPPDRRYFISQPGTSEALCCGQVSPMRHGGTALRVSSAAPDVLRVTYGIPNPNLPSERALTP